MLKLQDFAGRWAISRQITDHRARQTAQFTGHANLAQVDAGLWLWNETGHMRYGTGPDMVATRRYYWRQAGPQIEVLFEDMRPFHHFGAGPHAAAQHWCAPDHYDVAYDFDRWPCWQACWQVQGPRKHYRIDSLHRPATQCAPDPCAS